MMKVPQLLFSLSLTSILFVTACSNKSDKKPDGKNSLYNNISYAVKNKEGQIDYIKISKDQYNKDELEVSESALALEKKCLKAQAIPSGATFKFIWNQRFFFETCEISFTMGANPTDLVPTEPLPQIIVIDEILRYKKALSSFVQRYGEHPFKLVDAPTEFKALKEAPDTDSKIQIMTEDEKFRMKKLIDFLTNTKPEQVFEKQIYR